MIRVTITSLPPRHLPSVPRVLAAPSPLDRFVRSLPEMTTPVIAVGCVGAFMGAIPVAGAGVNIVAGIDSNHLPEATWPVGMLANMGGTLALFSGHPVIGGLGLAVSATTAFLLCTEGFRS